jgi:cyclase
MISVRVIPCLLLKNAGLVKTVKFKKPTYVGDPRNAVKIFNEKEVDELMILDINATLDNKRPQFDLISEIVSEAFMPVAYGGGIRTIDDAKTVLSIGVEKVILNTAAVENQELVRKSSERFGSQSVVISIDVKKGLFGKYECYVRSGQKKTGYDPVTLAVRMEESGAGELMINSIDRDGTMIGYDVPLIKSVSSSVQIPVIACGGAGKADDFRDAVKSGGAAAVAAGSLFVFHGKHRAVLINYPERETLENIFN